MPRHAAGAGQGARPRLQGRQRARSIMRILSRPLSGTRWQEPRRGGSGRRSTFSACSGPIAATGGFSRSGCFGETPEKRCPSWARTDRRTTLDRALCESAQLATTADQATEAAAQPPKQPHARGPSVASSRAPRCNHRGSIPAHRVVPAARAGVARAGALHHAAALLAGGAEVAGPAAWPGPPAGCRSSPADGATGPRGGSAPLRRGLRLVPAVALAVAVAVPVALAVAANSDCWASRRARTSAVRMPRSSSSRGRR